MGQVISLRAARQRRKVSGSEARRCPRCGADLWRIHANGRVFCGDCEQSYPVNNLCKTNT